MTFLWNTMAILFYILFISSLKQTENTVIDNTCNTRCDSYACMSNSTLCQRNRILSKCGCCHLCVKGSGELCGGEFGRYGVCGKGLRCTVGIGKFLLSENGPIGLCKPIACLRKCKRGAPVCGSNGFIFKNACEMNKFACLGRTKLTLRPPRECIDNRHCNSVEGPCSFVLQSSLRSSFHNVRRQSYGNCHGLNYCLRRYTNRERCADNNVTYLNKCQKNIHGCILGERLKWEASGKCEEGVNIRFNKIKLTPAGNTAIINTTNSTEQVLYQNSGEEYSGGILPTYNSSDPYSLT